MNINNVWAAVSAALLMAADPSAAADRPLPVPAAAKRVLQEQQVPAAAWVLIDNGVTYAGTWSADDQRFPAIGPDTYFHLASISKPMTAAAVIRLAEQGRLDLDARATSVLPELNSKDPRLAQVTVRQLLQHRAGVRHYGHRFGAGLMGDDALRNIAAEPLEFSADPGTTFNYQNRNYQLLGALIEAVSGQSYEDWVRREVLAPAKAPGIVFGCENAPKGRVAVGNSIDPSGRPAPNILSPTLRSIYPSGGACGSARDLATWAYNVVDCGNAASGKVLTCDGLAEMLRPVGDHALGWFVRSADGVQIFGHSGTDLGYAAEMIVIPARKVALALVTNFTFTSTLPIIDALLGDRLHGDHLFKRAAPTAAEIQTWTGRYWSPDLGWARIVQRDSGLWFVYQNPEFNYEVLETRFFPKPDWNPTGYYYAGTFRGSPMVLDAVVTADNPFPVLRTRDGDFRRVDNEPALGGPKPNFSPASLTGVE
jgi:CubicO group peptidase (beta-lactamase class C family)